MHDENPSLFFYGSGKALYDRAYIDWVNTISHSSYSVGDNFPEIFCLPPFNIVLTMGVIYLLFYSLEYIGSVDDHRLKMFFGIRPKFERHNRSYL